MTFSTKDALDGARKLRVIYQKVVSQTGSYQARALPFASAGFPGAGTLAGSNTANGVVPVASDIGFPALPSFNGMEGYISFLEAQPALNSLRSAWLYDMLFKAGAYAAGASVDVTLTSQPSFAGRVPGTDYKGLEIWIEVSTTFVGTSTVTIDYEDENGTPRSVATTLLAAIDQNRTQRANMASAGVSKITRVRESGSTGGAFNVVVVRRIANILTGTQLSSSASVGFGLNPYSFLALGLPRVYDTSALYLVGDSLSGSRTISFNLEIALK